MAYSVSSSITSESIVDGSIIFDNMPTNERLPAAIRDELRRAVALYCMDIVFQKGSMKVANQRGLMFDLYHGNDGKNVISHVKMLCNGGELFDDLFEERVENVVGRNNSVTSTKQLKSLYSRSDKLFYLGKHITVETMSTVSFNSKLLASGRMLLSQAKETLKTIKKACAELKQLVNEDGSPKNSGETSKRLTCEHSVGVQSMMDDCD